MRTITTLSPDLVAKIAAGEVVERPASVVKELIENALDARATHIDIELTDAGTKRVVVRDNGKDMHVEDLLLCYKPHTTSKITSHDDLAAIASFGFRGEALSSIAAVSLMTIKSRPEDLEYGTIIELISGELKHEEKIGMPVGTEIIVESLFHSTPARRKFLTDHKSELRKISESITQFAMAFPKVGFTLHHNDELLFTVPMLQMLQDRIRSIVGQYLTDFLIPIEHESRYGKVMGYIGKPQSAQHAKQHQYLFVNDRIVTDPVVAKTLTESYGPLLEPRAHPPFVLYLTLPYESVDVNIHPRKEEVAYAFPKQIYSLVTDGVTQALSKHDLTYTQSSRQHDMDRHTADFLKSIVSPWSVKNLKEGDVLQIHNVYLIAATDTGMLLIDQHAAHERILFEQFKEAFYKTREHQTLTEFAQPLMFELSLTDSRLLQEHIETLRKIGFDIEHFGKTTFKLSAVPEIFKTRDHAKLIIETLHDIKAGKGTEKVDRETEKTLAYLACRSAIKAGDALEPNEQKKLVEKLLLTEGIYTCPHGRPTHIEVSLKELDKMFKRR